MSGSLVAALAWRVILIAVLFSTSSQAADPGPVIPRADGNQCVADTDFMRRNHMDLMIHQRDDTVIDGIRGAPFSLAGCVDCHTQKDASGKAIRVDAEGQFCQSCHKYAAVKIDCFSCHAAVPDAPEQSANLRFKSTVIVKSENSLTAQIRGHLQADARR